METTIVLLIGVRVEQFPDYPNLSNTKTEWASIPCEHCHKDIWLGEKQRILLRSGANIPANVKLVAVCVQCGHFKYGVTDQTEMSGLTDETKDPIT
jgi:hypothetical protein